jgi:hypothetical protein
MNHFIEQLIDTSVALGKGVYSVGEDLVYGIERTAEGLGASSSGRISEIGQENEHIANAKIIFETLKYPFEEKGPLYKAIKIILIEYYSNFPEETLRMIAEKGSIAVGFLAGRMLIGTAIAKSITKRILIKIAASEGFKLLALRLGISTATTISGIGTFGITTIVGGLMLQGVLQRASKSAEKIEKEYPYISKKLKENGHLDMLYFLIEGPMEKHLTAIKEARISPKQFESTAKIFYGH